MSHESTPLKSTATTATDEKFARLRELACLDEQSLARSAAADVPSMFEESPVGRGYNAFGAYARNDRVKWPVLDFKALKRDGHVDTIPLSTSDMTEVAGNSLEELREQMTTKLSASFDTTFGLAAYSAEMSSSFASETLSRHEYSFATLYQFYRKAEVRVRPNVEMLRSSYMDETAKKMIDDPETSLGSILEQFGTHVLVDAVYGARFEYSSATNTWAYEAKTSMAASIQASFHNVTQSGDASFEFASEKEQKSYSSSSVIQVRAEGGRAELATSLESHAAWKASIADHEPVLVEFGKGESLIPIWEFAQDPARRKEIEDQMRALIEEMDSVHELTDLRVGCKIEVLDARDEGGPYIELYGRIVAEVLDDDDKVIWSRRLFDRPGGKYVELGHGDVHVCPRQTMNIEAGEDTSDYRLRLTTEMREEDWGNDDDYLGRRVLERRFVSDQLIGNHVLESKDRIFRFDFEVTSDRREPPPPPEATR